MSLFPTVGRRSARFVAATAALLMLATVAAPAIAHDASASTDRGQALGRSAPGVGAELARVRAATARYHDVEVALADGYELASAMGYHFVNVGLVGQLDPARPQALLYHPAPNGRLRLVGVEYLSPVGGELFGQPFADTSPPFGPETALHVWLWQANPAGMFAAYNPSLSCPPA
jgi:hypothetical protein